MSHVVPLLTPAVIGVLGIAYLVLTVAHHKQRLELAAFSCHDAILADVIRNPETDPAWSTAFQPWVKPGEDAKSFTLQRWLEFFRRCSRARVITSSQLAVNVATFMTLDGGTLMWALTRDARWQQASRSRTGRRFWHQVNAAFLAQGGEDTHADVIREFRDHACARAGAR